ncbi:MAG: adenylosuccinate lyase, partial [Pseudomonadales bacterium]
MTELELSALTAISPVDGRYARHTAPLREHCSEYGLIRYRVKVEVEWFMFLAARSDIPELPSLTGAQEKLLRDISDAFGPDDAARVKEIEVTTNHDVKAVEYFVKERLEASGDAALMAASEFVHFACT